MSHRRDVSNFIVSPNLTSGQHERPGSVRNKCFLKSPYSSWSTSLSHPVAKRVTLSQPSFSLSEDEPQQQSQAESKCSQSSTTEILVCKNVSCTKDGSAFTHAVLQSISTCVDITVSGVGCLGDCGCGPNVAVPSIHKVFRGIYSSSEIRTLLNSIPYTEQKQQQQQRGQSINNILKVVSLKEEGDKLAIDRNFQEASVMYNQAIEGLKELKQIDEVLVSALCNWSWVLLEIGETQSAIEKANEAVDKQPGRAVAWKRKAEASMNMKRQVKSKEQGEKEEQREKEEAISAWEMYGKLSGNEKEASKRIREIKRPTWFPSF